MIEKLSEEIVKEVNKTLDRLYNHRKAKEGLVSCHNSMIDNLKRILDGWHKDNIETEHRIGKLSH